MRRGSRYRRLRDGWQGERLECRFLLAGDLVAHWVAEDLVEPVQDDAQLPVWVDRVASRPADLENVSSLLVENQLGGRAVLHFSTETTKASVAVNRDVNPLAGADDFSVSVVFATSEPTQGGVGPWYENTALLDASSFSFAQGWGISINAEGRVSAGVEGDMGSVPTTVYSTTDRLNDGQVHVVTFVRSGGDLQLYVDDSPADTQGAASLRSRSKLGFSVGRTLNGLHPYAGDLAEIRIFDGALDVTEVASVHTGIRDHYSNAAPVPNDDQYSTIEDPGFFIVQAPGVLQNDTDSDGDSLTVELAQTTSNGRLTLRPDGSFVYIPDRNFFGIDTFTYWLRDFRRAENVTTVAIEVLPRDDPPLGVADRYKLLPVQQLVVSSDEGVLANDVNVDQDQLRAKLVQEVSDGVLVFDEDGAFTYDPQGVPGVKIFTYQIDDGDRLTAPILVTLVANSPPDGEPDRYELFEDDPLHRGASQGVLANDVDRDGNVLGVSLNTEPIHGTLDLATDGSFVYTPYLNYVGEDRFSYDVTDGEDRVEEIEVVLDVRAVNDAPTANGDEYLTLPDRPLIVESANGIFQNDADVEEDPLIVQLVKGVDSGTLTLNPDGSFEYTPDSGFIGVDGFEYRIDDGAATSDVVRVSLAVLSQPVVINEIMTSNAETITTMLRTAADEEFVGEGFSPDWFELRSQVNLPVKLDGMFMTDDPADPQKWQFPAGTVLPPLGWLTVFASGHNVLDPALDQQGVLHTNFELSSRQGYLAVIGSNGHVIDEIVTPEQRTHISYGRLPDGKTYVYFESPSPGSANGSGRSGLVDDTTFTVDRGFFTEPFMVAIESATTGNQIRFTTDGSTPTSESQLYTAPITINRTTTLRARAFKDGWVPSNTDTQTYVFLSDVVEQDRQSVIDAGFPNELRNVVADYGLDSHDRLPLIAGDETLSIDQAKQVVHDSLLSLPTLSIVMNPDDLVGEEGIYIYPTRSGKNWERATSIELIHPDGQEGFQIDAGIRIQGGAFRDLHLTRKKSFRLLFKNTYGPSKLEYPMFGTDAATEFDTLTLRMNANDGWQWSSAGGQPLYARDEFLRRTQLAMGHPAPHGTHVHLYINGWYWGMYNLVERPDEAFGASYFGSEPYNWDGQNTGAATNASDDRFRRDRGRDVWSDLRDAVRPLRDAETEVDRTAIYMAALGRNPDGSRNNELPVWLDPENYADYLIVNYYGGNADWPHNNYYAGRENSPESEGYKFFVWDSEWSMFLNSIQSTGLVTNRSGIANPFYYLRFSSEFRLDFADRVQKHLFNGGVLYVDPDNPAWDPSHPERNVPAARWHELIGQIHEGLIAESARWGDQHRDQPYTRDVEWAAQNARVVNQWFPQRSAELLEIFRGLELYPATETPTFSTRGGTIHSGETVELFAPQGKIYFTLDGSDPRRVGGAISDTAIEYTTPISLDASATLRVRALDRDVWSAIDEASFLFETVPATADRVRITEVHFNPGRLTNREVAAGISDSDELEFIEITNVSSEAVDLRNLKLTQVVSDAGVVGVEFDFAESEIAQLPPGKSVLVVENREAFQIRYGANLPVAGQWSGRLSNRSETITLANRDRILQQFTYDDDWYSVADGDGSSLEIVDPTSGLDRWSTRSGWRPSVAGGTPGTAKPRVPGDVDGDGRFTSEDLIAVFLAGKFEDGISNNATYAEGDWDGDGDFTTLDIVFAFQQGNFVFDDEV